MVEPTEGHTVKRYDAELSHLRGRVIEMGGLALDQINQAVNALINEDLEAAENVIDRDHINDTLEVQIDEEVVNLIARRQPVANDLRIIIAASKAVADLERIGDEAVKIARIVMFVYGHDENSPNKRLLRDVRVTSQLATGMLRKSLDAFDRLDVDNAVKVIEQDLKLDEEFQASMRHLVTYVMEDTRTIGHAINVVLIIKALERVGDHAKNIAEYIVYQVKGKDVRHKGVFELAHEILNKK